MWGPTNWSGHCPPKPPCPSSPTEPTLMWGMSSSLLRHLTSITKQIEERRLGIGALFLAHFLGATEGGPKRLVFRPGEVAPCRYSLPYSFPDLPTSPTPSFLSLGLSKCLLARVPTLSSRKSHPPPFKQHQLLFLIVSCQFLWLQL